MSRRVVVALVAGLLVGLPTLASAERAQRGTALQPALDVEELTPGQIQRAQEPEAPPPKGAPAKRAAVRTEPRHESGPPRSGACSGAFAKASSHLKLAM